MVPWNRSPKVMVDVLAWRRVTEIAEAYQVAPLWLRSVAAKADSGLAAWIKGHRYVKAVEPEAGESGMALLILWEVDHGCAYPVRGGLGQTAVLMSFSR